MQALRFNARLLLKPEDYHHPVTGRADAVSGRMREAVTNAFSDAQARATLAGTRDEVVITGKREQYSQVEASAPVDYFRMTVRLEGIPQYPDPMGMTIGFNPLVPSSQKPYGLQEGKAQVLQEILARHELAEDLLPRA